MDIKTQLSKIRYELSCFRSLETDHAIHNVNRNVVRLLDVVADIDSRVEINTVRIAERNKPEKPQEELKPWPKYVAGQEVMITAIGLQGTIIDPPNNNDVCYVSYFDTQAVWHIATLHFNQIRPKDSSEMRNAAGDGKNTGRHC